MASSLPISAVTSSLLLVLILALVVDDISSFKIKNKAYGDAERPLYGIILNGPYPKPTYSSGQYHPYLPYLPSPVQPSRPHPVSYVKPPASYYPTPSYYPVPPPPPPVVPYQPAPPPLTVPYQPAPPPSTVPYQPAPPPSTVSYQQVYTAPEPYQQQQQQQQKPEPYRPPVRPAPEPYRPPPVRPAPYRPPSSTHRPSYPIPTTFDNKPWSPIPTSASYVLDPYFQLNELDGYPWTAELRETDDKEEELKDKIPEILFKEIVPPKTLAQQHASANEINFSPNPERD